MQITFYGVRGSIASPGPSTASFGGNTSCVHVRLACGTDLIFDAGTGIRALGQRLAERRTPVNLLLTHSHFDHIQGFPFFQPVYQAEREIRVVRPNPEGDAAYLGLLEQMNGHNFPVPLARTRSHAYYVDDPVALFAAADLGLERRELNHPGGGYAYRLESAEGTLVFATDNELEPPDAPATRYDQWVEFCRGADVLIHDAQYLPSDMPLKHGWGHSLVAQVRRLAHDAGVQCLVLYHHDPERTDQEVTRILEESEAWFAARGSRTGCLCAYEGLEVSLQRQQGRVRLRASGRHPDGIGRPATGQLRWG